MLKDGEVIKKLPDGVFFSQRNSSTASARVEKGAKQFEPLETAIVTHEGQNTRRNVPIKTENSILSRKEDIGLVQDSCIDENEMKKK